MSPALQPENRTLYWSRCEASGRIDSALQEGLVRLCFSVSKPEVLLMAKKQKIRSDGL